jgi:hypothetical protein
MYEVYLFSLLLDMQNVFVYEIYPSLVLVERYLSLELCELYIK